MPPSGKSATDAAKRRAAKRVVVAGKRMRQQVVQDKEKEQTEFEYRMKLTRAQQKELKQKAAREAQLTQVNLAKITNGWRSIMRSTKVDGLLKECRILEQSHRRDIDRRDAILQMLERDIEEADEQYLVIVRSYLSDMDKLLDLQDSRLLSLESEFINSVDKTAQDYEETMEDSKTSHKAVVFEMKHLFQAIHAEEEEKLRDLQSERESQREEVNSANLERVHYLQSVLDNRIEELERAFESAHANYMTNTDQRTQDYKALMARGQKMATGVDMKQKKIRALKKEVHKWRVKLTNTKRDEEEKNSNLQGERDAMRNYFQVLKEKMEARHAASQARLADLSKRFQGTQNQLAGNLRLAERILQQAEDAREQENTEELIIPQAIDTENSRVIHKEFKDRLPEEKLEELSNIRKNLGESGAILEIEDGNSGGPGGDPQLPEVSYLDKFFRKYNDAMIQTLMVEAERDRLRNENQTLRNLAQQFLEGTTLSENTVRQPNPLLVINGADSVDAPPVRAINNNRTIVEAADMARTGNLAS